MAKARRKKSHPPRYPQQPRNGLVPGSIRGDKHGVVHQAASLFVPRGVATVVLATGVMILSVLPVAAASGAFFSFFLVACAFIVVFSITVGALATWAGYRLSKGVTDGIAAIRFAAIGAVAGAVCALAVLLPTGASFTVLFTVYVSVAAGLGFALGRLAAGWGKRHPVIVFVIGAVELLLATMGAF